MISEIKTYLIRTAIKLKHTKDCLVEHTSSCWNYKGKTAREPFWAMELFTIVVMMVIQMYTC